MKSQNDETITAYDVAAQAFMERDAGRSREGFYDQWLADAFSGLPKNATVLEIGSAHGRDALRLKEWGYDIQVSDATPAFVEYLRQHGLNPIMLDIVSRTPSRQYDAMFASAVFLHFTTDDFDRAVHNVSAGLKPGGKFIFSLIEGNGDAYSHSYALPRYFRYWSVDEVKNTLACHGLKLVDIREIKFEQQTWLYFTAQLRKANG